MSFIKITHLILAACLLMFEPLSAQQALNLQDIWQILLKRNSDLKHQSLQVEQSGLQVEIQKSEYLPKLNAAAGYNYVSELARIEFPAGSPFGNGIDAGVKNQYDASVSVLQPVFAGFSRPRMVEALENRLQSEQWRKQVIRNQLLWQSGKLYYGIRQNELAAKALYNSRQRLATQLWKLKNLMTVGQAVPFDTLQVSNRMLRLQNQIDKLQDAERILLSKLAGLLDQPQPAALQPDAVNEIPEISGTIEDWLQKAVQLRPELQNLHYLKLAASARSLAQEAVYYPQVNAQAAVHYARPGVNFFKDEWMSYYAIGIGLQWNLWNWNSDHKKVQIARLQTRQVDLQVQKLRTQIRQEVEEAWYAWQSTRKQIRFQEKLVAQERERFRQAGERFDAQQLSSIDFSAVETQLTEAEFNLQKEYMNGAISALQLLYASGQIGDIAGGDHEK